jgi:hypothetical protein
MRISKGKHLDVKRVAEAYKSYLAHEVLTIAVSIL